MTCMVEDGKRKALSSGLLDMMSKRRKSGDERIYKQIFTGFMVHLNPENNIR